jgi:hypothetical protein
MRIPPSIDLDGLVKSPSAALRGNFVVAAHLYVRLTPQFLRAWHPSFLRNHRSAVLLRNHQSCQKPIHFILSFLSPEANQKMRLPAGLNSCLSEGLRIE